MTCQGGDSKESRLCKLHEGEHKTFALDLFARRKSQVFVSSMLDPVTDENPIVIPWIDVDWFPMDLWLCPLCVLQTDGFCHGGARDACASQCRWMTFKNWPTAFKTNSIQIYSDDFFLFHTPNIPKHHSRTDSEGFFKKSLYHKQPLHGLLMNQSSAQLVRSKFFHMLTGPRHTNMMDP